MVADTNVIRNGAVFRRPSWFTRLCAWWMSVIEPRPVEDWTEPEPTHVLPTVPQPAAPLVPIAPVRRPHPPFAMEPAYSAHVLDRLIHKLVDLRADTTMTAIKAIEQLHDLNAELSKLAMYEYTTQLRMQRNQADAAAQARLLEDAHRRGLDAEGVAQATAGVVGRAVHVGDERATGTLPAITEDMPDPRTDQPAEAEPEVPMPSAPFLAEEPGTEPAEEVEPDQPWTAAAEETNESLSEAGALEDQDEIAAVAS